MNMEPKFEPLDRIDIRAEAAACEHEWLNQTLTRVNDSVVRLGVVEGEFHWHKHDLEDEFFLVIDGHLLIDLEHGRTIELRSGQGTTVPHGVVHRPRAPERTTIVMVEPHTVTPTGDD